MKPKKLVPDLIFKDECYAIIGACFEVYKDKGCGFRVFSGQSSSK